MFQRLAPSLPSGETQDKEAENKILLCRACDEKQVFSNRPYTVCIQNKVIFRI
jgi:hypothetical protein